MAQDVTLKVVGDKKMNCGGCERSVTAVLSQLPGVQHVSADRNTQSIAVTLGSPEADLTLLQAELREIGYEAVPA